MMSSTPETDLEYSATTNAEYPTKDVVRTAETAASEAAAHEAAAVEAARKPRAARRIPKSDTVLEAAVERARLGVLEVAPEPQVGRHVSATIDGERLVTHRFEAFVPGYAGWQWYSTLARVSRSKDVTVCEVGLLPGDAALLAPEWLPWAERVRPEDSEPEDGAVQTTTPEVDGDDAGAEAEGLADVAEAAELGGTAESVEVAGSADIAAVLDDDDEIGDGDGDAAEDAEGRPDAG